MVNWSQLESTKPVFSHSLKMYLSGWWKNNVKMLILQKSRFRGIICGWEFALLIRFLGLNTTVSKWTMYITVVDDIWRSNMVVFYWTIYSPFLRTHCCPLSSTHMYGDPAVAACMSPIVDIICIGSLHNSLVSTYLTFKGKYFFIQ